MVRELYHQASRNIQQNLNAKKIEVKYLPSTYLGRVRLVKTLDLAVPSMAQLLDPSFDPIKWVLRKRIHFSKVIAKDDNITDHYGSNFYG